MPLQRTIEHRNCPFEIRSVGTGEVGSFVGLAGVFHTIDSYGTLIDRYAFDKTLDKFAAEGFVTYEHRYSQPIGRPRAVRKTVSGLEVEGEIYANMWDGASVLEGMRRGVIREMSIGFFIDREEPMSFEGVRSYWEQVGYQPTELDLQRAADGVRLIKELTLEEVAVCMRGANPAARLKGVRSMLKSLFGRSEKPEEKPQPPVETRAEEPEEEDTVDEADVEALLSKLAESMRPAAREICRKKKDKTEKADRSEPVAAVEPSPAESSGESVEVDEEALSALLVAEHLLTDIEVSALEEGL